jgi:hypothetical protein
MKILDTEGTRHPLSKFVAYGPKGPMRSPARVLGWFSVGLGLAELLAPRALSRATGMPERPGLVRVFGLREIGTGIGLLVSRDPQPWLWGRVAGDALDILAVATGPASAGRRPMRTLTALTMLGGIAALDAAVARRASPERREAVRDYRDRSGFPRSPADMRGLAARRPSPADQPVVGAGGGFGIGVGTDRTSLDTASVSRVTPAST